MVSLPAYRIEPPDVLRIELVKLVPRPPYRIGAYDILQIDVLGTMPEQPINGYFLVEGEGFVTLGPAYGAVRVEGMTIDEATDAVTRHLQTILQRPAVSIRLSRSAETQQITGLLPGSARWHGEPAPLWHGSRGGQDRDRSAAGGGATIGPVF